MSYKGKLDRLPGRPSGEPGHIRGGWLGLRADLARVKRRSAGRANRTFIGRIVGAASRTILDFAQLVQYNSAQ